jgi:hypothetical protein
VETRRVVLQLGGANLGDVLDVACARFSRWAGGPTAAQLSKALRERWAASSPVVGAGVAVPPLPLAGAPVEATLVTLTAPLQGPTPDGVRASTVVVLLSPERDRGQPARIAHVARLAASTPRSPECAGRWSRSSASPSSSRSAEGAQKRSTATPCSSPPGTGESSRCTTTSRPLSTHAVEATVPGWNQ